MEMSKNPLQYPIYNSATLSLTFPLCRFFSRFSLHRLMLCTRHPRSSLTSSPSTFNVALLHCTDKDSSLRIYHIHLWLVKSISAALCWSSRVAAMPPKAAPKEKVAKGDEGELIHPFYGQYLANGQPKRSVLFPCAYISLAI